MVWDIRKLVILLTIVIQPIILSEVSSSSFIISNPQKGEYNEEILISIFVNPCQFWL